MEKIVNLDQDVIDSLKFLIKTPPPRLNLTQYSLPFVIGSGNALNTGKIIFSQKAVIFCDESSFKQSISAYTPIMKKGFIKQAVIISASGEKDSVWETKLANDSGLKTTLLTTEPKSSAAKLANHVLSYRKIAEPYTYNFSTYTGMILSSTNEPVAKILGLLNQIKFPQNFEKYTSYSFILPDKYLHITPMLEIKRNELFGPHMALRAFTVGHARHAGFIHPWEKELVITIGQKNRHFGHPGHRWDFPMPDFSSFATYIAVSYYIIGKIQKSKTSYFKKNIEAYSKDYGPKAYGKKQVFDVIVPGN